MQQNNVWHVTSHRGEDYWAIQSIAKAVVPKRGNRLSIPDFLSQETGPPDTVVWWHPDWLGHAQRFGWTGEGWDQVVIAFHDKFEKLLDPTVSRMGVFCKEAYDKAVALDTGKPVHLLTGPGAESALPAWQSAKRTVNDYRKIWLGMIGSASTDRKNQQLYMDVAKALPRDDINKQFGFAIIGHNWDKAEAYIRDQGYEVYRAPREEPGGQFKHFRNVDVYLMLGTLEGLPLPLLETMGCGIWPVATPTGLAPDIITEGVTGNLIDPWDVNSIVEALLAIGKGFLSWRQHEVKYAVREYTADTFELDFERLVNNEEYEEKKDCQQEEESREAREQEAQMQRLWAGASNPGK